MDETTKRTTNEWTSPSLCITMLKATFNFKVSHTRCSSPFFLSAFFAHFIHSFLSHPASSLSLLSFRQSYCVLCVWLYLSLPLDSSYLSFSRHSNVMLFSPSAAEWSVFVKNKRQEPFFPTCVCIHSSFFGTKSSPTTCSPPSLSLESKKRNGKLFKAKSIVTESLKSVIFHSSDFSFIVIQRLLSKGVSDKNGKYECVWFTWFILCSFWSVERGKGYTLTERSSSASLTPTRLPSLPFRFLFVSYGS